MPNDRTFDRSIHSAPIDRDVGPNRGNGTTGKVTLSAEERAFARQIGLSETEYARQKGKMHSEYFPTRGREQDR